MSVHESILYFSYSCVALIKVMFLCGYPQLLKILCLERWNDGTCLFFYFLIFCALCTHPNKYTIHASNIFNMLDERNHDLRQATTNHAVLNVVPLYASLATELCRLLRCVCWMCSTHLLWFPVILHLLPMSRPTKLVMLINKEIVTVYILFVKSTQCYTVLKMQIPICPM